MAAWAASLADGSPFSFKHLTKAADQKEARQLLKLFGGAPDNSDEVKKLAAEIGPTRVAFWDCPLNADWKKTVADARNLLVTEAKSENSIDRIRGVADNPRFTERVIAGAEFDFAVTLKVIGNENLLPMLLAGLKLLERDSLGGSGSRGYGKVQFRDLKLDGEDIDARFKAIDPFGECATC